MDARLPRNGIVWLGTVAAGAAWGNFFPLPVLAAILAGALVALLGLYAATYC